MSGWKLVHITNERVPINPGQILINRKNQGFVLLSFGPPRFEGDSGYVMVKRKTEEPTPKIAYKPWVFNLKIIKDETKRARLIK